MNIYAFDGTTYSGTSAVTNESGIASFTLAEGSYRFRADLNGTHSWSGEDNTCTTPSCVSDSVTVTKPLTITVVDSDGSVQSGLNVYAFNGTIYAGYSKVTNESGQAVFTLPEGDYRFRADLNGTQFWGADENNCTLPGCVSDSVTVTKPVTVTVAGEEGNPYNEVTVYAFDGETYSGYSAVTDGGGHVTFTLPEGSYHFRADLNGTQFWSAEENICTLPGCENVIVTVILPVTVTVVDTDGAPAVGLNIYAFDGSTYKNYRKVTDENGQAIFSLPEGDYRFRTDLNTLGGTGVTQFWSAEENTCTLPGCITDSVTVTKPVGVTVKGEEGNPYADLNVYAFNGEIYAGYSGKTDAGGHVTFTLREGSYHFRADYDGVQFWSGNENTCTIPGCEEDSVILPGGTGE